MTDRNDKTPLSYKDAGVDIAAADAFIGRIGDLVRQTHIPGVLPGRSEYAGLFRLPLGGLRDPVVAATCDGVGTKLLVAQKLRKFDGLGQDLVAMNVNDLLPVGARPLFFLDYIAAGKLDPEHLAAVVASMSNACKLAGCALLGGETAEMPDVYAAGDFDLAGFAVGIADGSRIPDPKTVQPGDKVLALPSSGVHSNGLSLARKALFERAGLAPDETVSELGRSAGEELLEPTRIYVQELTELLEHVEIKAAAHITGGGLLGRAERLVPDGMRLVIDPERFARPAIFDVIQRAGDVQNAEMARTFNMGLGFLVVLKPEEAARARAVTGARWIEVGGIVAGDTGVDLGFARS